jgi:hypothetical protein
MAHPPCRRPYAAQENTPHKELALWWRLNLAKFFSAWGAALADGERPVSRGRRVLLIRRPFTNGLVSQLLVQVYRLQP